MEPVVALPVVDGSVNEPGKDLVIRAGRELNLPRTARSKQVATDGLTGVWCEVASERAAII